MPLVQPILSAAPLRSRDVPTPLYRLRVAYSLFQFSHPVLSFLLYRIQDAAGFRERVVSRLESGGGYCVLLLLGC